VVWWRDEVTRSGLLGGGFGTLGRRGSGCSTRGYDDLGWSHDAIVQAITGLGDVHDGVIGECGVGKLLDGLVERGIKRLIQAFDPLALMLLQGLVELLEHHFEACQEAGGVGGFFGRADGAFDVIDRG